MKVLKGLQSCVILDRCVEFKVYSEKSNIVLDFYYSCGNDLNGDIIRKFYPLTSQEVDILSKKQIEIDFICNNLISELCKWLSDDSKSHFDLKYVAQKLIDEYLKR